ncbi:MAG: hypothetical protein ABEJ59_01765 [Halanaeroarchaeum sp.]
MSRSSTGLRTPLLAATAVLQALAGALAAYAAFVLSPAARQTFDFGPLAAVQTLRPLVVPVGLALAVAWLVLRDERPSVDLGTVGWLLGVSFVGYYVGFWAVGIPTPTPGGRVPVNESFVSWALFEPSSYVAWAWVAFLRPAVDGAIAALAGVALGMAVNGRGKRAATGER